jgi:hypothetical protein
MIGNVLDGLNSPLRVRCERVEIGRGRVMLGSRRDQSHGLCTHRIGSAAGRADAQWMMQFESIADGTRTGRVLTLVA